MTIIHLVDPGAPARPPLTVAESHVLNVPAETSRAALLAHTRRVAQLLAELSTARGMPEARQVHEHHGWAWLPALGVALSQALDLGMETDPGRVHGWVGDHAFPSGRWSMRDALRVDVPRYQHGRTVSWCPIPGPRGGACKQPGRTFTRLVTDPMTGDWVLAMVCPAHRPQVDAARIAAPTPPPNRGGILARVFPEWDLDGLYGWADDRYTATGEVLGANPVKRPRLRVIDGGIS